MRRREYARDRYQKRAKQAGYRSRAAYKLQQIDAAFGLFHDADIVIDLGAAPGGWSQVAKELVGPEGIVIGMDLHTVHALDGVTFLKGDITDENVVGLFRKHIESANVVISDISPHISGQRLLDHARSIDLADHVLTTATALLSDGGDLVVKVFQGELLAEYMKRVKRHFKTCKGHSPHASRPGSSEIYIVAKGFRKKE